MRKHFESTTKKGEIRKFLTDFCIEKRTPFCYTLLVNILV